MYILRVLRVTTTNRKRAMPNSTELGHRIRHLRRAAGINQTEAAKRAGIAQTHWSAYERGQEMTVTKLRTIAEALGVPPEELFKPA